jgi:hypothetical protein
MFNVDNTVHDTNAVSTCGGGGSVCVAYERDKKRSQGGISKYRSLKTFRIVFWNTSDRYTKHKITVARNNLEKLAAKYDKILIKSL